MRGQGARHRIRERGQILPIFCLVLALLLLPVAGLAVDGGLLVSGQASLAGAVQGAAQAGAQALDVTALQQRDQFQLCAVADGGPDCGNGVGTVSEVVSDVLLTGSAGLVRGCTEAAPGPLPQHPPSAEGCAFQLLSGCASDPGPPLAAGAPAEGVRVSAWRTLSLPLLVFPGWSQGPVRSTATAWLEHGFAGIATGGDGPC